MSAVVEAREPEPPQEEIQRVREWECSKHGHSWNVIEGFDIGPIKVICNNCGADSGLVKRHPGEA